MAGQEIVVVGAGLAGLSCARELTRAGVQVHVVEAHAQVGGRVRDVSLPGGGVAELGAQWVGTGHAHVLDLVREFGLELAPGHRNAGDGLSLLAGPPTRFAAGRLLPESHRPAAAALVGRLESERHALEHDPVRRAALFARTASDWLDEHVSDELVRSLVVHRVHNETCASPGEIAAAALPDVLGEGLEPDGFLFPVEAFRIVGGPQQLATGLAAGLPERVLHLARPVDRVEIGDDGVTVASGDLSWHGDGVVLTVPLPLVPRIRFRPSLPGALDQVCQRVPMGSVIKTAVVYPEPFWRGGGLAGLAVGDGERVTFVADGSPPDGSVGVLTVFVTGPAARRASMLPAAERRDRLISDLVGLFGAGAVSPVAFHEQDWMADPFVRGGYGSLALPGVDLDHEPGLDCLVGTRMVVTGSGMSDVDAGYMNGALHAGARAGQLLLERLARGRAG